MAAPFVSILAGKAEARKQYLDTGSDFNVAQSAHSLFLAPVVVAD